MTANRKEKRYIKKRYLVHPHIYQDSKMLEWWIDEEFIDYLKAQNKMNFVKAPQS